MPDIGGLLNWSGLAANALDTETENRAESVEFMIGHRGVNITLVRNATPITAQKVLVVPQGQGNPSRNDTPASSGAMQVMVLVGLRDHATLADFDVQRDDRFVHLGASYVVRFVDNSMPGKTEAYAEARQ